MCSSVRRVVPRMRGEEEKAGAELRRALKEGEDVEVTEVERVGADKEEAEEEEAEEMKEPPS